MTLTISSAINALKALCAAHTSLGATKFFRTDLEFEEKMRSITGFTMLLNPIKGRLGGENEAQIYKYYTMGFAITKPVDVGSDDAIQTAVDDCELIAMNIMARMRQFSVAMEGTPQIFPFFKIKDVTFETTSLEFDNRMGFAVYFTVYDQVSLAWDATDAAGKWTDVP